MNLNYVLQRLALAVVVIFGVTIAVFLIVQLVPGDPARVVLGVQATDENIAIVREQLGLNRPLHAQYIAWLSHTVRGDLGTSLITNQPVGQQIAQRLPASMQLAAGALLVGLLIAFPLGIIAAMKPGSPIDIVASVISQLGISIPDFWLGILLVMLFSLTLGWLPTSSYTPMSEGVGDWLRHLILPSLTAGLISGSVLTRFVRSAMLEVFAADYIRTARAKGLREYTVVTRHAFRNALIPIVTVIGLQITTLLSAVVVVEIVFAWPGLGRLALNAVLDRDYPLLQGTVLVTATFVTLVNLAVDLLYFFLDPRLGQA